MTANIDQAEIDKFDALAYRWWDEEGDFRPLHDINPLRVNYIDARCPVAGKRIIDVGCGGGILSEALARDGGVVTGIDMGEAPLSVARLHALEAEVEVDYRQTTAEQVADEAAETFDIVTCLEMLEHVPDPASVIAACARIAKPDGHLFFSTINRNPAAYALAVLGAEYVLSLLPRGTHDYRKFLKPSELARYARQAGLETVEICGMRYNPFSHRASLTRDTSVNYLLYARKPH